MVAEEDGMPAEFFKEAKDDMVIVFKVTYDSVSRDELYTQSHVNSRYSWQTHPSVKYDTDEISLFHQDWQKYHRTLRKV